jgi:hypothetical protein
MVVCTRRANSLRLELILSAFLRYYFLHIFILDIACNFELSDYIK